MWRLLAEKEAKRGLLSARGEEIGMGYDVGLPESRLRVLRARFDARSPVLGGEDGFLREKRILEGGCKDLERVVEELLGIVGRRFVRRDRNGGRRRRMSL